MEYLFFLFLGLLSQFLLTFRIDPVDVIDLAPLLDVLGDLPGGVGPLGDWSMGWSMDWSMDWSD